ncbi:MAG TPA: hypothetical protein VH089_17905, partial [Streptosporangiaceae bacterium]|nr:hypothetical protein [Streptosporangiaceae bacterium]
LESGAEFVPIYAGHPGVTSVGVADLRADLAHQVARQFNVDHVYADLAGAGHRSFVQGGGHGGSHPHLVHEFVSSVRAGRAPFADDVTAANWTATGIAAHQSALRGGQRVAVPNFD